MGSWVHLDVVMIVRKTEKAFLLRLEDGEELWVPCSQVSDADSYEAGDMDCTISVTRWFADKEGLD